MLVDLSGEASVVVSEHAKAYFGMTSVHKDVATGAYPHGVSARKSRATAAAVALVESGGANQAVIKVGTPRCLFAALSLHLHTLANARCSQAVHTKTRDVLQKLRVIAGDGSVTQEVTRLRDCSVIAAPSCLLTPRAFHFRLWLQLFPTRLCCASCSRWRRRRA